MRKGSLFFAAMLILASMGSTAYAAEWRQGAEPNENRWWYDNEDGTTPDGYEVNADGAWIVNGIVQTRSASAGVQTQEQAERMRIQVKAGDTVLWFELNDSPAARDLYRQLPLTVPVSDYSDNEKIFYPPEKLDTAGTPVAHGGAGTLAYYRPWGNVVMFYGDFRSNNSLYELGRMEEGSGAVGTLTGTLEISKAEQEGENQ